MKTFVVTLRETHETVALIDLDEEYEEATVEEAKRQAVERRQNGDLQHVGNIDATVEAGSAWEVGAPCVLAERSGPGGTYIWCALHLSGASGKEAQCYEARSVEAIAGAGLVR